MRFYLTIFVISFAFLACGPASQQQDSEAEDSSAQMSEESNTRTSIPVRTLQLDPQRFVELGEYYGSASGIEEATVIAVTGGTVEEISVREGQSVSSGDSLGKVNSTQAQAAYELAVLNERIASENYERQRSFFAQGNTSQLSLDQAQLAWYNARTSLLDAQKMRDGAFSISPIDGIVIQTMIKVNQELPPGSPTFSVAQTDRMIVSFGIPERDMQGVELGNPATVSFAIFPGQTWEGELVRLSKELDSSNRTFEAEVEIANPTGEILVGLTARVELVRAVMEDQIVLPSASILSNGDDSFVMVADEGVARRVPVLTGSSTRTATRLIEGPSFGSMIITEGNHLVTDGSAIRVIEE